MKLNKVLALALSGVMAVSMLAGCSGNGSNNGGSSSGEEQPPVDDTTIASVLNDEQADNDVKVNFTYSSSLETALQKTLSVVGNDADDVDDYLANVLDVDDVVMSHFYGYSNQNSGTSNTVGEQTAVIVYRDDTGLTDEGSVKQMYDTVLDSEMSKLTSEWTDPTTSNQVKWNFSYTGEVAAVSGVEDNQNYTYVAIVVTCNTTKALAD